MEILFLYKETVLWAKNNYSAKVLNDCSIFSN